MTTFSDVSTQCHQLDADIKACIVRALDDKVHPATIIGVLDVAKSSLVNAINKIKLEEVK